MLWINSTWKPIFIFSLEKLKYHYSFGSKLILAGLIDQVFNNSYNILIGKFFPLNMLGYFERSKQLNEFPATAITSVIGKVSYPMLSEIQDDKIKIAKVYKKMLKLTFL